MFDEMFTTFDQNAEDLLAISSKESYYAKRNVGECEIRNVMSL